MANLTGPVLAALIIAGSLGAAAPVITGDWQGTYRSRPDRASPDGTYQEAVNRFKLTLEARGGAVSGRFEPVGTGLAQAQDIKNYGQFGRRHCFDITALDSSDMRWCLTVRRDSDSLVGTWNLGPQGGPAAGGLGIGARLYSVAATRVK
jgi:hypothetical protein